MFPAGEVSTYKDGKLMADKLLEEGAIKTSLKSSSSCDQFISC
jgi:hypothetical protein